MARIRVFSGATKLALGVLIAACLGSIAQASTADSGPIQMPGTSHWYQSVSASLTWGQADAQAKSMTFNGMSGHLVTITSAAEDAWIAGEFPLGVFWMGARDIGQSANGVRTWQWATGPEAGSTFTVCSQPWWADNCTSFKGAYSNWHSVQWQQPDGRGTDTAAAFSVQDSSGWWYDGVPSDPNNATGFLVEFEPNTPPSRVNQTLGVGYEGHACALESTAHVTCWGRDWGFSALPQLADVRSMSAGGSFTCVVRADGSAPCFGFDWSGVVSRSSAVRDAVQVSAGGGHACALLKSQDVECWGTDQDGESSMGPGSGSPWTQYGPAPLGFNDVIQVSAGSDSTCVVHSTKRLQCWGSSGVSTVPFDVRNIEQVSVFEAWACATTSAYQVRCWGSPDASQSIPSNLPPAVRVSTGAHFACALTTRREVWCWGQNQDSSQPVVTADRNPIDVAAGGSVFRGNPLGCALLDSGTVTCWGEDLYSVVPGARQVTAGALPTELQIGVLQVVAPGRPENLIIAPGDSSAVVAWTPPASGGTATSYTATADPSGASCTTSGLTCKVSGLSNRLNYTFTVTASNEVGTSPASAPSSPVMPLAPGFQMWPTDQVVAIGVSTAINLAQAAGGSSIALTGAAKATLVADSSGAASASYVASKSGLMKFTAAYSVKVGKKTTRYSTTSQLWVPSVLGPGNVKVGKSGSFKLLFCPPSAPVVVVLSDGRKINLIADAAGKASSTLVFGTRGAVTYTVAVAGVQVFAGGLTVS